MSLITRVTSIEDLTPRRRSSAGFSRLNFNPIPLPVEQQARDGSGDDDDDDDRRASAAAIGAFEVSQARRIGTGNLGAHGTCC